jgi:hypothetical protein
MNLKGIKKLVNCGLISLIGLNLFVGCSSPFEPEEISPITFELNTQLEQDKNGYYHLKIDTTKWQTLHRVSGHVYRDGESVNVLKFGWGSSHHWLIGDDYGYIVSSGYTDDLVYVNYDTTYITGFTGWEVPIVNGSSYSRMDGEVNTMIAPIRTMKGDTATIYYGWYDDWTDEEITKEFYVIFD